MDKMNNTDQADNLSITDIYAGMSLRIIFAAERNNEIGERVKRILIDSFDNANRNSA